MAQKISLPLVNATLVPSVPTPEVSPKVTTFIGQKLAAGTAAVGFLEDITNGTQAALFGAGSMLDTMITAFRKIDINATINAYVLEDNGGGVDATGTIAFGTGPADGAGTYTFYIGNTDRVYSIAVADGDTISEIGDTFDTAVAADADALITSNNAGGTVTITAKNAGTVGNNIGILYSGTITDVTVTLTGMASGATDPVITAIPAAIGDVKTDIVMPVTYSYAAILTWLDTRFNVDNEVLEGVMFLSETDTASNIATSLSSENSENLVYFGDKPVSSSTKKGGAIFAMPYEKSAQFAAVRALRFSDDTIITDYVTTTESKDQFGGVHTASLPYHNTPLDFTVIPGGEGFTTSEVAQITVQNGSVMGNNTAGNTVICGSIYTSYKTNAAGAVDLTYEYLNYRDTATSAREYIFNALKIDYGQKRLTSGTGVSGYSFASEGSIKSDIINYLSILQGDGYVLVQGGIMSNGATVISVVKRYLTITINNATGVITITTILPIVTQVQTINIPLNIVFDPASL